MDVEALVYISKYVNSYSLIQTELFLRSLLDEEPVKTVVAPGAPRSVHHRAASKDREKVFRNTGIYILFCISQFHIFCLS